MAENLSQRILTFHTGAYEPYENAIDAVFSRYVSMAQSVRAEGERIASKFRGIEAAVREGPVEIAPHLLATTSAINRIYDNSVDIVDLVMPQTSIRIVFNWALLRENGEKLDY